jgi:hypothetical protein
MENKFVFIIQGYEQKTDMGELIDVVIFELFAKDYEEAESKAKTICKKPFYRLTRVIETSEKQK